MATLKRRLHRNNGSGYDTVHFETEANLVLMSDGTTAEAAINGKAAKDHTHETSFTIISNNEMNLANGYSDANGNGDVYFNFSGASKAIKTYSLCDGKGNIIGTIIHTGNIGNYIDAKGHVHTGQQLKPGALEMTPGASAGHGGYIDFHYNSSSADYTARIIEDATNRLNIVASNGVIVSNAAPSAVVTRNIVASTSDLVAGSSDLATGSIYLVYE